MKIDRRKFYNYIRNALFGGAMTQSQVEGLELCLDTCLDADFSYPLGHTSYVLASIYHETGFRMVPVRETFASTDEQAKARLESSWRKGRLPWVKTPYWRGGWFGRGHIQITWETNYLKQERKLKDHPKRQADVPWQVHENPDLALHPQTSILIAVFGMKDGDFTGKNLDRYIQPDNENYRLARYIVNGQDRASLIAKYAREFETGLKLAGANTTVVKVRSEEDEFTLEVERVTVSKDKNHKHKCVELAQILLNFHGFSAGAVDGIAGSAFERAVTNLQNRHQLPATGVCDEQVWSILETI